MRMDFLISASTDTGIRKLTNQDSLSIKKLRSNNQKMVFAVLCDGVGGLKQGEIASATVVDAFNAWLANPVSSLHVKGDINQEDVKCEWKKVIHKVNEKLKNYGRQNGISLGTTVVVMLLTERMYYVLNIGDSRVYEIKHEVKQITKDQTLVEFELEKGIISQQEAKVDKRKHILLQCVGASNQIIPEFIVGETKKDAVYMLCSDGFVHKITQKEMFQYLQPEVLVEKRGTKNNMEYLIELNKQRDEKDNISIAIARTF